MIKRSIAILTMLVVAVTACDAGFLTTADDDDMSPLIAAIRDMNPRDRYWIEVSRDLDAVEKLKDVNPDRPVADVYCGDGDDSPTYTLTIKMLYHLLKDFLDATASGAPSFNEAIAGKTFGEHLRDKLAEQGCRPDFLPYVDFTTNLDLNGDRSRLGGDKANRATVEWLIGLPAAYIQQRPYLMAIIGVSVVGVALVALPASPIGLALCPLSEAVSCPDSPAYPPGQTPQPDQGDRP